MHRTAFIDSVLSRPREIVARHVWIGLAIAAILALAFINLTSFPVPWFDEGSHLHVPKAVVRHGVYADYSSEGFRYYGPSIGIGPTVMLPIAAAFKVFGIGLLQARLVMAGYLVLAIAAFFILARATGGARMAWLAVAILVGSRAIGLLESGRQVLGEIPALAYLSLGWFFWVKADARSNPSALLAAGALFGLAAVTKSQFALILIPTLCVAWLANLLFYRRLPHRYFLLPLAVAGGFFAIWQVIALAFLGPGTLPENLALLRQFSSGAAFVFSPDLIKRSINLLLDFDVFGGWIIAVLIYGMVLALRRTGDGQRWGNIMIFVVGGLVWYVFASISWLRYAFAPLSFVALVTAKLIDDLLDRVDMRPRAWWAGVQQGSLRAALAAIALVAFATMSLAPLALTARNIIGPPPPYAQQTAGYLEAHIPRDALIETWEPELGFLTDHNYHFPPHALLDAAVRHVWLGGPSPDDIYDFGDLSPDYVITGVFSQYAGLYAIDRLEPDYQLVSSFGPYNIYARRDQNQ